MAAPQSGEVFAEMDGERPALIEPGTYDLRFDHHSTCMMFGRAPKLALWFTIISMGPYYDKVQLVRYYNVRKVIGRPAKNGRFKAGWMCNFTREYGRLFRLPSRLDRISMTAFSKVIIVGTVRTVITGSDQCEIPEQLRYSVIDELVRVKWQG
jgi:hypothetical protein